ncbi:MAG TPA: ATP-binding protein [Chloroflexota bacterium]|nr:ATP-binding protein [Chloroflexota bacterium]
MGYPVAVLGQVAAVSLTLYLRQMWPRGFPYEGVLVVVVVIAVALRWDFGPSMLATLLGAALVDYYVLSPHETWSRGAAQMGGLVALVGVGLTVSLVGSRAYRARQAAEASAARERELREKAEAAVQMRDEVLTLATHDMRTPVTAALGHAQLVQYRLQRGSALDAAWLDAQMQAIGGALMRLNAMIDEMRDVAHLQVGQALDLQLEEVDVSAQVRAVAAEYSVGQGAPRVAVHVPAEAARVCGDRARLERVLHNLIGNAVKYSPQGTPVDVTVQTQEQRAVITVRDQGVGIPAEELPRIFTRFFRASTARGVKGTGIGLAGSKAIIEQHHGHITVESVVGRGTTVTVCLPRSTGEDSCL